MTEENGRWEERMLGFVAVMTLSREIKVIWSTGSGLWRKCCAIPVNYVSAANFSPLAVRMLCDALRAEKHRPWQQAVQDAMPMLSATV